MDECLRAAVIIAARRELIVEALGELQTGKLEMQLIRGLDRDAHILDEMLDEEARRIISLEHARCQVRHGPGAGRSAGKRFYDS